MADQSAAASPRPERQSGKFISLEIARFVAAFCVAVDHLVSLVGAQVTPARQILGGFDLPPISPVIFFFTLSGFVMMTAHGADYGRLDRIGRYAWRRICRIYPLYWLSLAAALYYLGPSASTPYLTKIITLSPFQDMLTELNSPAWSLRFEIAFYIMFGISLLPYIGRIWLFGWIILVFWEWYPLTFPFRLLTVHGWHLHVPPALAWHFFGNHCLYFFAGLAAGYAVTKWRAPRWACWALLAVAICGLPFLLRADQFGFGYPSANRAPLIALATGFMILALAFAEKAGVLRLPRRLGLLGAMSYPLYLFHPMVIFLTSIFFYYHPQTKAALPPDALFGLLLLISLGLTAAVTFLFDRPLQHWLRRPVLFARKLAPPAV